MSAMRRHGMKSDGEDWVTNSSASLIPSSNGSSRAHFSFQKSKSTFGELCCAGFHTPCIFESPRKSWSLSPFSTSTATPGLGKKESSPNRGKLDHAASQVFHVRVRSRLANRKNKRTGSARLALQPCGFSISLSASRLLYGNSMANIWNSRRAEVRALRYKLQRNAGHLPFQEGY